MAEHQERVLDLACISDFHAGNLEENEVIFTCGFFLSFDMFSLFFGVHV